MAPKRAAAPSKKGWDALFEKKAKVYDTSRFDGIIEDETEKTGLKLICWNVNGIRAVLKKDADYFESYVERENPDILCLSETKCNEPIDILTKFKYRTWSFAQNKKGYSGTAIFSKQAPLQTETTFLTDEGRFIAMEFESFWLVHTYVPNSGQKLDRLSFRTETWDLKLLNKLNELKEQKGVIWCGDLNVAHEEIDIHDPKSNRNKTAGFTDAERENFSTVLSQGYVDIYRHLNPSKVQYTYWSYRNQARAQNKGWRLDYFVLSENLVDKVEKMFVRDQITGSDHCPIGLVIN